jgi:hypothetical protein
MAISSNIKVKITKNKTKDHDALESWVLPESVPVWESKGWKVATDKDAKAADKERDEAKSGDDLPEDQRVLSNPSGSTTK